MAGSIVRRPLRFHPLSDEMPPPFSEDAERAVLCGIFLDNAAMNVAKRFVEASMFSPANARIYSAMEALAEQGDTLDPLTVLAELQRRGEGGAAGGRDYIEALLDEVPNADSVPSHARIVRDRAAFRRVLQINEQTKREIAAGISIDDALKRQQRALAGAAPLFGWERQRRFSFLDEAAMETLADPSWRIQGVLPDKGLFEVHGRRGAGKGFVVLDMGMCVQTGLPFHGHGVNKGQFVYVSVEGSAGLKLRRRAWLNYRGYGGDTGALFLTSAVPLMDPEAVSAFLSDLHDVADKPIAMVVFDTLAKCMVGGDENSTRDMGLLVAGLETVQRELDCLVGIVHHMGRSGDEERGNTALGGAADAMFKVTMTAQQAITVQCTKMKDHDDDITLSFRLEPEPQSGSMILTTTMERESSPPDLAGAERQLLELLSRSFPGETPSTSRWLSASALPDSTFYRHRGVLVATGYVQTAKHGKAVYNSITPKGHSLLALNSQITPKPLSRSHVAIAPTNPPSLEGVGGGTDRTLSPRGEASRIRLTSEEEQAWLEQQGAA